MRSGKRGVARRCRQGDRATLAVAAVLALSVSGCFQNSYDVQCQSSSAGIELSWNADPRSDRYHVYRAVMGGEIEPVGEATGTAWVDGAVEAGTEYHYLVRPIGADQIDIEGVGECSVTAAGGGLGAVADLVCRSKDGKVDLSWSAVPGAAGYRVTRTVGGMSTELGITDAHAFADFGLANGALHDYAVAAVDEGGTPAEPATCSATPNGQADALDPVSSLACRAKRGKVDLTWPVAAGAESYQVLRSEAGGEPVPVGETENPVFADFGLVDGTAYTYSVRSRRAAELASASPVCTATPGDRAGNLPPEITSSPLTTALVERVWYYDVEAVDSDGGALAYALDDAPPSMTVNETSGLLVWSPLLEDVGSRAIRVRVTDPQGASAVQVFSIEVTKPNEAPRLVSTPPIHARAGEAYDYDADAFDPDGDPVRFELVGTAPDGVTLDGPTGQIHWTPAAAQTGIHSLALRALDAAGGEAAQQWSVQVVFEPLAIVSPVGPYEIRVGETLTLPLATNYGTAAGFSVRPQLPGAFARLQTFTFTPDADDVGPHEFWFKARIGPLFAQRMVTINVLRGGQPPVLAPLAAQTVRVGELLRFAVIATDPDGDALLLSAPGLSLENAFFDAVGGSFEFRPAESQIGSLNVTFAASDGEQSAEISVPITVEAGDPTSEVLDLVVDPPQSPTFSAATRITGSVRGEVRPPEPPGAPLLITGLAPATIRQGRTAVVDLTGSGTAFATGSTSASFGDGITVESFEVLSPTSARASVRAANDAALGVRTVLVAQDDLSIPSIVGFHVEAGAASLTGVLRDPFTEQPIVGARVSVNGLATTATTDADGRFVLEGVPPGQITVLFSAADHATRQVDLAIDANQTFDFSEPVGLDALARPFAPGGSLPRAARLASLLDRGVTERGAELNQEQAEAVVEDTLLVVGGNEVGVLDEAGNQLNPAIQGAGFMTVTRAGIEAQARALIEGDTFTLGTLLQAIQDAFQWVGDAPMTPEDGIAVLQDAVDEAWANPQDPNGAMAIVVFNEGRNLSARPPRLGTETPLNRFQSFLLVTSFVMKNYATLSISADDGLRSRGVDPAIFEDDDPSIPPDVLDRLRTSQLDADPLLQRVLAGAADFIFGAAAHADTAVIIGAPNGSPSGALGRFEQMWKKAKSSALSSAVWDGVVGLTTYAAGTMIMATVAGSTGGITGATAGIALANVVVDGVIGALMQKIFLGLMLDLTLDVLSPQPPVLESAQIVGNKVYLTFSTSSSEQINQAARERIAAGEPPPPGTQIGPELNPEVLRFTYQLYRFPNAIANELEAGELEDGAFLRPVPERRDKLQFVIPYAVLRQGPNYFRVRTVQYIHGASEPLQGRTFDVPADPPEPFLNNDAQQRIATKIKFDVDDGVLAQVNFLSKQQYETTYQGTQQVLDEMGDSETANAARKAGELRTRGDYARRTQTDAIAGVESFRANHGEKMSQTARALEYAQTPGLNPDNFEIPETPEYMRGQELLGLDEDTIIADDLAETLKKTAAETRNASDVRGRIDHHNAAQRSLETHVNILQERIDGGDTQRLTGEVATVAADGTPLRLTFDVEATPQGIAELDTLIDREDVKIRSAQAELQQIEFRQLPLADDAYRQNLGNDWVQHKENVQFDLERIRSSRLDIDAAIPSYLEAERRALDAAKRQGRAQAVGQVFRAVDVVSNTVAPGFLALGFAGDALSGVRVLGSDFSTPFLFVRGTAQGGLAPAIEFHPDFSTYRGMLVTRARERRDPRPPPQLERVVHLGDLVTVFPSDDLDAAFENAPLDSPWVQDAGFTPDFLAIDSHGVVYTLSKFSYDQYGGRLFRFIPQNFGTGNGRFAREHAGNVSYYNLNLQYGHPVSPVAMAIAPSLFDGTVGEDLFVANTDFINDRKEIRRIPISQIERQPSIYGNGQNRGSLAGSPYATHPDFQLTTPNDMITARRNAPDGLRRMYLSDQNRIFVLRENLGTGDVSVAPVIVSDGARRFSGMAFDAASNLYVADYASGEVFVISWDHLLAAEQGANPCLLRITKPGGALRKPVFLAIDPTDAYLVASTEEDGLVNVGTLPVLLKKGDGIRAISIERLGKQLLGLKVGDDDGSCDGDYFLLNPSQDDRAQNQMQLRVQLQNANGQEEWRGVGVGLRAYGSTILDLVTP